MSRIFFILFLTPVIHLRADFKQYYFERYRDQREQLSRTVESAAFDQILNSSDPKDTRTFEQRYYFDKSYAKDAQSPVFFYLCGEAACSTRHLSGAIAKHAQTHRAFLVALEHRYYGKSQPFDRLTTENLRYLTTENALLDANRFQKYFTKKFSLSGPWVVVGGSYPGSLAAYYRLHFPKSVVGALASSGPVQAKENFEEYDRHVALQAGKQCLIQIKKTVAQVELALENKKALLEMKKKFQAEVLEDDIDFVYLIADMAALAVQYGYKARFCELLEGENPLQGYAGFTKEIFTKWGINALSMSAQGGLDEDPKSTENGIGMRQWFYQSCTEYGYWQNAYPDESLSARSKLINLEYHHNICRRLFGIKTPADTEYINKTFYEPMLERPTSNILYTNGSTDPWMNLSIAHELGNAVNPHTSALTIQGAAHCDDLRAPKDTDTQALKAARALFSEKVSEWIKD